MIYSNPEFLIFFAITSLGFLFSKSKAIRFNVLLFSSLFFYSWAGLFDALVFVFVVIVSWLSAFFANKHSVHKKRIVLIGVMVMVLHLFVWKYAAWVIECVQYFHPSFLNGKRFHIPLPVGISFFTLQGIAYLIDFSFDKAKLMSLKEYVLFKSYFPQLVAGPIVRASQIKAQLDVLKTPSAKQFFDGLFLFSIGFFKKLAIADRMAPIVDSVFANPDQFNRSILIQAVLAYSVQIWGDFSGYTDMGRGVSKMLGIDLPENFLSPYLAKSPSDFWKRWHITLSEWIRDYIYIPLGGSRGNPLRVFSVAIFTMIISGLWHGASMTFLLWGLYHGTLLVFERATNASRIMSNTLNYLPALLKVGFMYGLTCFGWLIFRANGFTNLRDYFAAFWDGMGASQVFYGKNLPLGLAMCFLIQIVAYFIKKRTSGSFIQGYEQCGSISRIFFGIFAGLGIAGVFIAAVFLRFSEVSSRFIYFQF